MSKNLTPAVRFNGFTDVWEQQQSKGVIPAIRFDNFTEPWCSGKGTELFKQFSDKNHVDLPILAATQDQGMIFRDMTDRKIIQDMSHINTYKRVLPGQFVIHLRSFQGGFAYSNVEGITSPAYTVFGLEGNDQYPPFWGIKFVTPAFINYLRKVTVGIRDGRSIDVSAFMQLKETYAPYPEQTKIASLFSTLDKLVALRQRKLELLQRLKKAMLQQMFPDKGKDTPQLRFSGFNDAWEQRKLGELLNRYKELASKDGTYPHVSLTKEGVVPKSDKYDRDFLVRHEDKQYRVTHLNDICYNPANLKFGVICRNTFGNGIFSPIYVTYQVNAYLSPEFIGTVVTRIDFIKRALKYQEGTVYERMSVAPEDLEKMETRIPNKDEQDKIAVFLSALEKLSTLGQRELKEFESLKKFLLQQMFV